METLLHSSLSLCRLSIFIPPRRIRRLLGRNIRGERESVSRSRRALLIPSIFSGRRVPEGIIHVRSITLRIVKGPCARTSWRRNDIITIIDPEHSGLCQPPARGRIPSTNASFCRPPTPSEIPLDPREPTLGISLPPSLPLFLSLLPSDRSSASLGTADTHDVEYPSGHPTLLLGADWKKGGELGDGG